MIIEYVECADGTRQVHLSECEDLTFQTEAGEVWEVEVPDHASDDEIIVAVWDDFFEGEEPDEDTLETYSEMTVFMPCTAIVENELVEVEYESSGNPKADEFMDAAEAAGWAVEFSTDDDLVSVKAFREYVGPALRTEQVLDLTWSSTRLIEAHHLSGLPHEVAKRLSSVAGALKILTEPHPKPRAATVLVDREFPVKRVLKKIIPFDLDEAYDDEIISAVQDRTLVWWNDTSEDYETHFCMRQKNHIRIETGNAGRAILTFISPEGFRSVALENLVQVK